MTKNIFLGFSIGMISSINNVNTTNQIHFTSRNKVIRRADDIVRLVNKEYPMLSNSYVKGFKNINKFENVYKNLTNKVVNLRELTHDMIELAKTPLQKIHNMTDLISALKCGNCMEGSLLCMIAAKVNGLKNITYAILHNDTLNEDIDHIFLLVNDNTPYIMDTWLGFADYVPNSIKKYKNEFCNHFKFDTNDKISIKCCDAWFDKLLVEKCSKFDLQKDYYNLLLPDNKKKI